MSGADAPVFRLSPLTQEVASEVTVPAQLLTTDSGRFTFVLPHGWRAQAFADKRQIRMAPPNSSILLTLSFRDGAAPATRETAKAAALSRHPGTTVVEEFPIMGFGKPGFGLDLESKSESGQRVLTRVAIVDYPGGELEAEVKAAPSVIGEFHHPMNTILLSLRHSPLTGKLQVQPLRPE